MVRHLGVVLLVASACATTGIHGTVAGHGATYGTPSGDYVDHPGFIEIQIPRAGVPGEHVSMMLGIGDCSRSPHDGYLERGGVTYVRASNEVYMAKGSIHIESCGRDHLRASFSLAFDDGSRVAGSLDMPLVWTAGYD